MRSFTKMIMAFIIAQTNAKVPITHPGCETQEAFDRLADTIIGKEAVQAENSINKATENLGNMLLVRSLCALPPSHTEVDSTTLGKSSPLQTDTGTSRLPFHLPRHSSLLPRLPSSLRPRNTLRISGDSTSTHCNWIKVKVLCPCAVRPCQTVAEVAERPAALAMSPEAKEFYAEVKGAALDPDLLQAAPSDFFELLGIKEAATEKEIKAAYRRLQKVSHPDIAGEVATPLNIFLNLAYNTLMDKKRRKAYVEQVMARKDKMGGTFDGQPVSKWAGPACENRAVFVDESLCVGCKQCALHASNTFALEAALGKARCTTQWGDDETTITVAAELCPVRCIYWVDRGQLPLLEYAMKLINENRQQRNWRKGGSGALISGGESPFCRAETLLRLRREGRMKTFGTATAYDHDEMLEGAIAAAWLSLPADVKRTGWPEWSPEMGLNGGASEVEQR
jgi:ferredoxin